MRKLIVALCMVALIGSVALATTLSPGDYAAGAFTRSNGYRDLDGGIGGLDPLAFGSVAAVGDESRTVINIKSLETGLLGADPLGVPRVIPATSMPYQGGTLTAMLYDIDISVIGGTPLAPSFEFAPGTRYAGAWTDTYAGDNGFLATGPGYGGLLVIYDSPVINASFAAGPGAWAEGGSATTDAAIPGGVLDNYPTISNDAGQPWLIAVLAPMHPAWSTALGMGANTVLYEEFGLTGAFGMGFANIIGGTAAGQFDTDVFGAGLDIRIEFEPYGATSPTDLDGWQVGGDDPIQFTIIPEPASLTLLGLGIAGLAAWRRKRK